MKRLASLALALALALFAWNPVLAFADTAEQDTQTEELEIATQGSNSGSNGSSSSGSSNASSASGSQLAKTGDETSMLLPACLAGAALGSFALSRAVRKE